jgi:hypothetical protein
MFRTSILILGMNSQAALVTASAVKGTTHLTNNSETLPSDVTLEVDWSTFLDGRHALQWQWEWGPGIATFFCRACIHTPLTYSSLS